MGFIIPLCLTWIFFEGFLIERCEGVLSMEGDGIYTLIGEKKTLTCRSSEDITDTISFLANPGGQVQGTCIASGTCGSTEPGYNVTQDRPMRTTTLQILSFDQNRDKVIWYCQDGSGLSKELVISPVAKIPDARIQVSPKPSLNAGDSFTVTVEFVGYYCSENVTFIMKLANSNEYELTGSPTNSSTLLSGNATSSSITAQAEMSGNISLLLGCGVPITIPINAVVLTVTVPSTVTTPPPTTTTPPPPGSTTVASSTGSPVKISLCSDVWYEDASCLGLIIGGIILLVVIIIIVCCCVWRQKKPQPKWDTDIGFSNELSPK